MKYTPGQVQEMLQLSPATFRHWKEALPPVAGRNGHAPCFSAGDMLAMALIRILTQDLGIKVSKLYDLSSELFQRCGDSWAALERSILLIEPFSSRFTLSPDTHGVTIDALSIAVPMRPVIAALRERLLLEQPESAQEPLRFPPTALGAARRSGKP